MYSGTYIVNTKARFLYPLSALMYAERGGRNVDREGGTTVASLHLGCNCHCAYVHNMSENQECVTLINSRPSSLHQFFSSSGSADCSYMATLQSVLEELSRVYEHTACKGM